jgi:hypothetical protein
MKIYQLVNDGMPVKVTIINGIAEHMAQCGVVRENFGTIFFVVQSSNINN